MTVRLQMKLGLVPESQRPADSPDSVLVVEPSIGSTSRTKGSLYLVVTGVGGGELRTATNMVAERIRHEYYYDESCGITVCLKKAIKAANRELRVTERLVAKHGEGGPIGIALAVVRGNELYVATVGPAEAYLVRQARLLTLPEPGPVSGLPNDEVADAEVWHGAILAGDSLILISPNATRRIGLAPIQEAVIQLHPQVAIDQIHRQLTGGGIGISGGDGMIALEADEVSMTQKIQPLKPVWPSDSLAGVPDRSPIPLADTIVDRVGNVQHTAKHMQRQADGITPRCLRTLRTHAAAAGPARPDHAHRRPAGTPAPRRQRRGRHAPGPDSRGRVAVVSRRARQDLHPIADQGPGGLPAGHERRGPGLGQRPRSTISNPPTATHLLEDAYSNIGIARANGDPDADLAAIQARVVGGLNLLYHVNVISPSVVLSFGSDRLDGLVLGPEGDGGSDVIDGTSGVVYRVDLVTRAKREIAVPGAHVSGGVVATPRLLAVGGPDVLILHSADTLWRWRPAVNAAPGDGTLVRVDVDDSGSWGSGVRGSAPSKPLRTWASTRST